MMKYWAGVLVTLSSLLFVVNCETVTAETSWFSFGNIFLSFVILGISYLVWNGLISSSGKDASTIFNVNTSEKNYSSKTDEYADLYDESTQSKEEARKSNYMKVVNHYYDLATDFYEWGWGESFHFAPRHIREDFKTSLARHEMYLALKLRLQPGMKVADVGCGVGGPMREISRFSRCYVTGINNNAYQISRGEKHNRTMGLDKLCNFLKTDFMNIPVKDGHFDAGYAIEATCHAPDKVGIYKELYRILKPGGEFVAYEWCMTDKYDPNNAEHRHIKHEIEIGDGLPCLYTTRDVDAALKEVGFEILETEDLAIPNERNPIPWYSDFLPSLSLKGFKLTKVGITLTHTMVNLLEALKIAPKGTSKTHSMLIAAARGLSAGGINGIFTPAYFFHVRKPLNPEISLSNPLSGTDPTQAQLAVGEECILLDENDKVIGKDSKKNCHLNVNIEKGLLHRAFSILLFNGKGELLLQQRSHYKITFPLYWTNTVCSHPLYNDEELEEKDALGVKRAAVRKIEQEIGIKPSSLSVNDYKYVTRIHYKAPCDETWGEHEIDYILVAQADVEMEVNPNEVAAVRYVNKEELKELMQQKDIKITPWFKLIVEKFLFQWWDKLSNIEECFDHTTIHRP